MRAGKPEHVNSEELTQATDEQLRSTNLAIIMGLNSFSNMADVFPLTLTSVKERGVGFERT